MTLREILWAPIIFIACKGCTAYELEIGVDGWRSVYVRWCHLSGGHWSRALMWSRFSVRVVQYDRRP
jgi:hypothetical protein